MFLYIKKDGTKNPFCYILTLMYLTFFIEGFTESLTGAIFIMPLFGLYVIFVSNDNRVKGIKNQIYEKNSNNNICVNL